MLNSPSYSPLSPFPENKPLFPGSLPENKPLFPGYLPEKSCYFPEDFWKITTSKMDIL
jgi:hypothetical protein